MISAGLQRDWLAHQAMQTGVEIAGSNLAWMDRLRARSRQALSGLPVHDRKLEAWRYTNIEGLLKNRFAAANGNDDAAISVDIGDCPQALAGTSRLVFVDGRCVPGMCTIQDLPPGAVVGSLRAAFSTDPDLLVPWLGQIAGGGEDIFSALNTVLLDDGLFIHLGKDVELDRPVEVVYLGRNRGSTYMMQPRNLVVLESGARATLIERCAGTDRSAYFNNCLTEISVGDGASLSHYRVQDESSAAWHMSNLYLCQQADSTYHGITLAFGSAWSRTGYHARFRQPGGNCRLNGLYAVGDRQFTDFHLDVRHEVPACTSRARYKGILYGRGRAVFDGHILVDRQAQKSDASLTNDNLILTRDAEVDTKPQLEIHADDVKCSHGTTVGELDPQQLYYMRSRGIGEAAAAKMLCLGFADAVLDAVDVPGLRDLAVDRLGSALDHAATAGGADA